MALAEGGLMEGTYSIWHLLIVGVVLILLSLIATVPTIWGLRKAGWSGWWCLLFVVPVVNLIFLWVFAFGNWPNEPSALDEDRL